MKKVCIKCNQTKVLEEFPKRKDRKDGRLSACKVCENLRKKKYAYTGDQWKEYRLKKKFGITLNDYAKMLETQNHCCAICQTHINDYISQCEGSKSIYAQRKAKQNFSVDHCHTTGKIRGLLCYNCNLMLGNAKDDPNLLIKAVEYLKK